MTNTVIAAGRRTTPRTLGDTSRSVKTRRADRSVERTEWFGPLVEAPEWFVVI